MREVWEVWKVWTRSFQSVDKVFGPARGYSVERKLACVGC